MGTREIIPDHTHSLLLLLFGPNRSGDYREGYMEVMRPGPVPDLRDMPDCPRKAVDENTMQQHRNCFKASEDRIRIALRHGKPVSLSVFSLRGSDVSLASYVLLSRIYEDAATVVACYFGEHNTTLDLLAA